MKKLLYFLSSLLIGSTLNAQTLVLHVNGEAPDTLSDKTGLNDIQNQAGVYVDNGAAAFMANTNTWLYTDSLANNMDINQDWTFECKLRISDSTDEIALIDFRSTSSTGNMYFYYNRYDQGLHFSDRNLNGDAGHLVADYMLLPQDTWVNIKLERANGHLKIYRDGIVTADTTFTDTLSPIARTTIGYSEDRRELHNLFWMDDIKIYAGTPTTGVQNIAPREISIYPNPAGQELHLSPVEKNTEVSVWDIQGRIRMRLQQGANDISALAPGVYFVRTFKPGVGSKAIKIVKDRESHRRY